MRMSDGSSDVCASDLRALPGSLQRPVPRRAGDRAEGRPDGTARLLRPHPRRRRYLTTKENDMTKIALIGAGGKMGVRLATNLRGSRFAVDHVEVSEEGRKRLKDGIGVDCVDLDTALAAADVVILAVPDRLIGNVAHEIIDRVRPGTALIVLDAARSEEHTYELPSLMRNTEA